MLFWQIVVLALVQGLTEFLPISSSAHLILVPVLSDWPDQGLAFDVVVHLGTLTAVLWYFRKDVMQLSIDWTRSCVSKQTVGESRLAWIVIIGTIPVGAAGLLLHDVVDNILRSPLVIAWATIGFGLLLGFADFVGKNKNTLTEHQLSWKNGMIIGFAQALALIPGTSRSGITMTAGLFTGLTRQGAARFSFLLSIPVILMAGSYKTLKLIQDGNGIDWISIGLGYFLSAVSAYVCIHYFLKMLERIGMTPFVIYRVAQGVILLYLFS
ncbi:MAG: undecaprenyl-diphosphate phosphatase [Gammaproteobacteria bacterium]|nr:undecaprenyl-diphosphate phosphatase [Gammaproteobacteria bacterium]